MSWICNLLRKGTVTVAAPIIDSITPPGPITAKAGSTLSFVVVAHDADAKQETLSIVATDAEGNASAPATVVISWSDPVTITATLPAGSASKATVSGTTVTVVGG